MSEQNWFSIPVIHGRKNLKVSNDVKKWWGSFRDSNIYEPQLIELFLNKLWEQGPDENGNYFFLDVGANTGSFCLMAAFFPQIKCLAYEPNKETYDVLEKNIFLNELQSQVSAYNIALWSEDTKKKLCVPQDKTDSGLATLSKDPQRINTNEKNTGYNVIETECRSLDSHLAEVTANQKVSALKIDTEGADLYVLKGAKELILRDKQLILTEFDNKNTTQFGYDRQEIIDFLASLGYRNFSKVGTNPDPNEWGDLIAEW